MLTIFYTGLILFVAASYTMVVWVYLWAGRYRRHSIKVQADLVINEAEQILLENR